MAKILIVEDELKTAEYLRRGLSEEGWTVDCAANGEDGLHLSLTGDYDALVLDMMLPGLDGVSLLRRLRQTRDVPVIMLTALDEVASTVRCASMISK